MREHDVVTPIVPVEEAFGLPVALSNGTPSSSQYCSKRASTASAPRGEAQIRAISNPFTSKGVGWRVHNCVVLVCVSCVCLELTVNAARTVE